VAVKISKPQLAVPAASDPAHIAFFSGVKEFVDQLQGNAKAPLERVPTIRELQAAGLVDVTTKNGVASIASKLSAATLSSINTAAGNGNLASLAAGTSTGSTGGTVGGSTTTVTVADTPTTPLGFSASGITQTVLLGWTLPTYAGHSLTEIWRSGTNDLTTAVQIGAAVGSVFSDPLGPALTAYYWIRFVNINNAVGPWNAGTTGGTAATTTGIITAEIVAGQITAALLAAGSVDATKFASSIAPVVIQSNHSTAGTYVGQTIYDTTDHALYQWNGTAWVTPAGTAVIPDGSITAAKLASTMTPIAVYANLAAFPAAGTSGRIAFTADTLKLYKDDGTSWVAIVNTTDIAGTIAAAQIAANSIGTAQITAAGIAADRIVANSIGTTQIAAGGIAADRIVANSITTTQLAAAGINADRLVANSITAGLIAAGAITTSAMTANTISGSVIQAGTMTTDKLTASWLTAGVISAGAISASQIAAGAITTDKLRVASAGAAINTDPGFQDASAWTATNAAIATLTDGQNGLYSMRSTSALAGSAIEARYHPIDQSKTYRVHCWARNNSSGANGTFYAGLALLDSSGTNITNGAATYWWMTASGATTTTGWTEYVGTIGPGGSTLTTPSTARQMALVTQLNTAGTAGYIEVQDLRVEEVLGSTLIQDGAITTNKILANAITGGKIAAGEIVTTHMAADSIAGDRITVNTLNGSKIVANSITAAKIDSTNLTIKDGFGNIIFGSGASLAIDPSSFMNVPSSWLNTNLVMASDGTLTTGGTVLGSATLTGLGFTGDTNATRNLITFQASPPASPAAGDIWVDTSTAVNTVKIYAAGAWTLAANYVTNTNQITDGANLGYTATWAGVSGTGKPADGATKNVLTISGTAPTSPQNGDLWFDSANSAWKVYGGGAWTVASDITAAKTAAAISGQGNFATLNQITAGNASTYIQAAAIQTAQIANAAITNALIGTAQVGTLNIADGAVTIPVSTYANDYVYPSSGLTEYTMATLTATTSGNRVALTYRVRAGASPPYGYSTSITVRLRRDGVLLDTVLYTGAVDAAVSVDTTELFDDTPTAGTHVYAITIEFGDMINWYQRRGIRTLEVKR
jgi:hypothetical protein